MVQKKDKIRSRKGKLRRYAFLLLLSGMLAGGTSCKTPCNCPAYSLHAPAEPAISTEMLAFSLDDVQSESPKNDLSNSFSKQ